MADSKAPVVNNNEFNFTLLPNGDPYVHAQQFAARIAGGAQ